MKKSKIGIYGNCPIALLQEPGITLLEIKAYIALSSFQGMNELSWPSLLEIGKRANLHPNNASAAINKLKKRGWVTSVRRGIGMSNQYCVLHDLAESANTDLVESTNSELAKSANSLEKNNRKEQYKRTRTPPLSPPRRGSKPTSPEDGAFGLLGTGT